MYERIYGGPGSTSGFCGANAGPQGSPQPFVAATHLAYCRIFYHQIDPETQFRAGGWTNNWNQPDMPAAVRIDMAPAVPDPMRLPAVSITAQLHVNRSFEDLLDVDQ